MKRLQTYFAVLTTIFGIAGAIFGFVAHAVIPDNPLLFLWIIFVCGSFTLVLSLIIGHFIAEPLEALHIKIRSRIGGDAHEVMRPEGKLHEADQLAEDLTHLFELSKSQMKDLQVQQQRKSEFISDAAHELRTPLTAIRGNAEMLLDPDMPRDLHDRFCQTIIEESERLSRLSNDLLALQRIEGGHLQRELARVNLHDLAENVVFSLTSSIEKDGVAVEVIGEAPDVLGNADQLSQVIGNLVSNALRFVDKENGRIVVKLEGLADQSVISVTDNGPGFGDVDQKLLFSRFYRGDNSRARNSGGTGLGLPIVKSIVDQHDGTIEAINTAEGGACFIVALPSVRITTF